jgi:inner membrane transporter RhtA
VLQTATRTRPTQWVPPHAYFVVSAVFHYLGPAFAVLLFAQVSPPGVACMRIVSAALVFAVWRRPWRTLAATPPAQRRALLALGVVLAAMNTVFYLAIASLPLATVGAIEFLGPVLLALIGLRGVRNLTALTLAACGVALLTNVRLGGEPLGFVLAFVNCALFVAYVVLGKRIAVDAGFAGVDRLALAMLVAAVVAIPFGVADVTRVWDRPILLAAGFGVGVCSSVVPYVCDQLALARLPRASYALLLSLLPATAVLVGVIVLGQLPSPVELAGIAVIVAGVALHRPSASEERGRDEVPAAGKLGADGVPDLPGHDELRRPDDTALGAGRGGGGAVRASGR